MSACACECDGTPPDAPGNKGGARADETRGPGNGQTARLLSCTRPAARGKGTKRDSRACVLPCHALCRPPWTMVLVGRRSNKAIMKRRRCYLYTFTSNPSNPSWFGAATWRQQQLPTATNRICLPQLYGASRKTVHVLYLLSLSFSRKDELSAPRTAKWIPISCRVK